MKASMAGAAATFNALPTQMALLADALRAKVEAGTPAPAEAAPADTAQADTASADTAPADTAETAEAPADTAATESETQD
jgi:large subunit ribosomal protein L10